MSNLLDLQNKFQHYLLSGEIDFKKQIVETEKVPSEIRLAIYGNAYHSRLVDALATNYPALYIYLGTDMFAKLAADYIESNPSCFRSIRWFGDQLANFIDRQEEYKQFPYLVELAEFEWNMTLVFDAEDNIVLKLDDVARIPPDEWCEMKFRVHPSVKRLNLFWNVIPICEALLEDQTPDEPIKNLSMIPWLLWRKNYVNHYKSLADDEAWAIDAVFNNASFGEICEGLCEWVSEEEAGLRAASLLKAWIEAELLVEIIL